MQPGDCKKGYASVNCADSKVISRQIEILSENELLCRLYKAVSEVVLIVNSQRQIVFFNEQLCKLADFDDTQEIYGKRPGEALGCIHAFELPEGCGATEFCVTCGGANAIMASGQGLCSSQECRILRKPNSEAVDLLIKTTPLELSGEQFSIVSITDISHEKRRNALERLFFHDLLNTASALKILAELLNAKKGDGQELSKDIKITVRRLMDEIYSHKQLAAAESDELTVRPVPIQSLGLLKERIESLKYQKVAKGRQIILDQNSDDVTFISDHTMLGRVLANMLKNALEACRPGQRVTIGCRRSNGNIDFWVHNPGCINKKTQLQLFKRSFSTKGRGRGLGTYSIKLLSERYLNGNVDFISNPQQGTIFTASYPINDGQLSDNLENPQKTL